MNNRRAPKAVIASLFFILTVAVDLMAQNRLESGGFVLSGRIVSQRGDFQKPFTVQLYRDSLVPLAEYIVRPQDHFEFQGLNGGVYFVVADVPGFKKIRERFDLNRERRTTFLIFLEEQQGNISAEPLELMGSEDLMVNVDDLAPRPPELMHEFQQAGEDLKDGDVETARQRLEEVVRKDPDFYDARMSLGETYQQMLRHRDAEAQFRIAADLRSGLASPWTSLGRLYLQEAETNSAQGATRVRLILNDAIGSLLHAIDLNPNAALPHYLLGVAYFEASFYEDAEDSLIHSLQLEPRLGTAQLALANVYTALREWPAAMTRIDTYLKGNPGASNLCHILSIRSQIAAILDAESGGIGSTEVSAPAPDDACGQRTAR